MRTSDLRDSRDAHSKAEMGCTFVYSIIHDLKIPAEHMREWEQEILGPLKAIIITAGCMARQCADQAELQGSGHAVEADAQAERMR